MTWFSIQNLSQDIVLGLQRPYESLSEAIRVDTRLTPVLEQLSQKYHNESILCQKLSIYTLLFDITNDDNVRISHNEDGKPIVNGWHFSASDTKGCVAVIMSKNRNVAVDVEHLSDRVSKVANRFIRPDEQADTIDSQLIHWSAKEVAYKYYSEQRLQFHEMRITPFIDVRTGEVSCENLKSGERLGVSYCFFPGFVCCYAAEGLLL